MRLRFFGRELLCGCGILAVGYYAVAVFWLRVIMRMRFFGCRLLCGCGFLVVSYYVVAVYWL